MLLTLGLGIAVAQQKADRQRETVAKPISAKEQKKRLEKLKKELETPYRRWLDEDVAYIITDEERAAFKRLETDEEREQFIEQFWLRRDPTPDTIENEYKEEHYRRIAYANERFASGIPGWKTDRGRIYITFGPPDENESHPSGGSYQRPWEEGGGITSTYPFEVWRYRYIEGVGTDVEIEFVDPTMTGEYHMTMDPSEKDALLYVPGAGLTQLEQMGLADKSDRFNRTDGTHLGTGDTPLTSKYNFFNRLEQYVNLQKPPAVKFKDLEAAVSSKVYYNVLPFEVRADYIPATESTVMTNITVQFERKDMQFKQDGPVSKATVNIYGRITSMTRRVVNVFEDVVSVEAPTDRLEEYSRGRSIYNKTVPLAPGIYRLNIVAKDINGGNMDNYELALNVPRYSEDELCASSLILADKLEKVPTRDIGTGQFVIGGSKVRPRVGETFHRSEKMGIFLKIYNFQPDEKTHKPDGTIQMEVLKKNSNEKVLSQEEDVSSIEGAASSQVTLEKLLNLSGLEPGDYILKVKIVDRVSKQTITPSASFKVTS